MSFKADFRSFKGDYPLYSQKLKSLVTLIQKVLLKLFCTGWMQIYNSEEHGQLYYINIFCKNICYFYMAINEAWNTISRIQRFKIYESKLIATPGHHDPENYSSNVLYILTLKGTWNLIISILNALSRIISFIWWGYDAYYTCAFVFNKNPPRKTFDRL